MEDVGMDIGFDRGDEIIKAPSKKYQFKLGTYRVSFVSFNTDAEGNKTINFKTAPTVFIDQVGGFIYKDEFAPYVQATPKQKLATVLAIWPTDKEGNLKKDKEGKLRMDSLEDAEVITWIIPPKMFQKLKAVNTEFPLNSRDVKLTCNEEKYQDIAALPCSDSIYWTLKNSKKAEVRAIAEDIDKKVKDLEGSLLSSLGMNVSVEELKKRISDKLGTSAVSAPAVRVNGVVVDDNVLDDFVSVDD